MKTAQLGDHVEILSGFAFKSDRFNDEGRGLPLVRIRDVKPAISTTYFDGDFDERFVLSDGDLLVGMDGEFNCARWAGGRALFNQRVCRVRAASKALDEQYLFWFLPKALKEIEDKSNFVTVKHLSGKQINEIEIPLPALDEQKRIAAILDQADDLRRKRKQALDRLNQLGQAIFYEMFGDPASVENDYVQLSGFVNFITSGGRGWSQYYVDEGDRFIRSLDVQMNYISNEDPAFVDAPDNAEARRTVVLPNDVLLTITGSKIGRVAPVPDNFGNAFISQHVAIIRLDLEKMNPTFLSCFLSLDSGGQKQISQHQYGQTKPGLNFDQISRFRVPNVSIEEQGIFADRVSQVSELFEDTKRAVLHYQSLFSSLQHRAFRGEL